MHEKFSKQLPLTPIAHDHPKVHELEAISRILDRNPVLYEMVLKDLGANIKKKGTGAKGMSAEQAMRAAIVKQMEGYSYEELAFHIADSSSYRKFCKISFTHRGFKKSALCENIKAISPETWESVNKILLADAQNSGIEKGRKVRIDCTVVSSDIHEPTDSELLWDSVRVLARIMNNARKMLSGLKFPFQDHSRRAKRRALGIKNAKNNKVRKNKYMDLLKVTRKTIGYAQVAAEELKKYSNGDIREIASAAAMSRELEHFFGLVQKVAEQTQRRVINGEEVLACDKIVSIFEEHTDIIKKDKRDTFFGHKVCLTGGVSNLILDCVILEGNPPDSTLSQLMLERQEEIYGRYPLKAALDGGFASKTNLKTAKEKGIKDVCFAKGRGLKEEQMCRSVGVYKLLRRFRAGIESGVSWLKRSFGLGRCLWKGFTSFKSYVWSAIVSANLLTMARKRTA